MQDKSMHLGCCLVLIFSLAIFSGCGGSSVGSGSSAGSNSMTSDQAQSFATSVSRTATSSMQDTAFKEPSYSASLFPAEQQTEDGLSKSLYAITCTQTSCLINQAISATRNCTSGGSMRVSGNLSGTISSSGSGTILIDAIETITDWSCLPPLVINGDPYISLAGTFSFLNGVPATQQHVSINGGIKWGSSSLQTCQVHLSTDFNRNGTGRTTGTVCGININVSF